MVKHWPDGVWWTQCKRERGNKINIALTGIVPPWLTKPPIFKILPMPANPRYDYHVVPDGSLWKVTREGAAYALLHTITKAEAVGFAIGQAREGHVSLIIHGRDGKIQKVWSYDDAVVPDID